MIGLMILLFFAVCLAATIWITRATIGWARSTNRKPWLWGGLSAFVMYNLVFWDWIPTLVMHKYYCETQAGFWVYKTPEQWKKENPGVAEGLVMNNDVPSTRQSTKQGFTDTYYLNQRINRIVKQYHEPTIFPIYRIEQEVMDSGKDQVLARYTDFFSGYGNFGTGGDGSWRVLKFWLTTKQCAGAENYEGQFLKLKRTFEGAKK